MSRAVKLQRLLATRVRVARRSPVPDGPERSILVAAPPDPVPAIPAIPSAPSAAELLRLFYLGRPVQTAAAYRSDLDAFAAFARAPSAEEAVARLLRLPRHAADAVAQEWKASLSGAPATRARRLATLRSLVKTARRYGVVSWELDLKMPRVTQYRDTAGPGLDALRKMLRAAETLEGPVGARARATLLLVSTLALRREEVARLRVGDYNRQTRRIFVIGKREKEGLLAVPDITARSLDVWIDQLSKASATDALIQRLDKPGARVSGRAIYKIIAMLGKLAGVRTWPHGIRHTAVTEVTREDGLVVASKFARHSDVKTTMIYQDNLEDVAGKAAARLEKKLIE